MNIRKLLGLMFFAMATMALVAYRSYFLLLPLYLNITLAFTIVYLGISLLAETLIRVPLAERFRNNVVDPNYEPTVTLTIPVFNEADVIASTVKSALASNYPKEKLEVIVVDDGSSDGSAGILDSISADNLKVIHFGMNKGKREALYAAFKEDSGEIAVTIDSDTLVDKNFVRNIVSPFSSPDVGGVCGYVDVVNKNKNLLTRMQASLYVVAFFITRRSESLYDTVTCISGCAAAYRLSALNGIIDEWRAQRFLGSPCKDSEDRGLTTMLLRSGYSTIYAPDALTSTYVPERFAKYAKQQIRWRRGFLREAILGSKFMYKRGIGASALFYANNLATVLAPFVTLTWVFIIPIFFGFWVIGVYLAGAVLTALGISIYCKVERKDYSVFSMLAWAVFNLLTNPFLSLYAFLTVRSGSWLTR